MIFFSVILDIFILYFLVVNLIYLVLFLASFFAIEREMKASPLIESVRDRSALFSPPISVIAPAYNEELTIIESVKSFLLLRYPRHEVVVVNDGSTDNTLPRLKEAFLLQPASFVYDSSLSETETRGIYSSRLHDNLIVIDKKNGGKADALNVGIGFSHFELFCAVDSDSILEEDALVKVAIPFIQNPKFTIASGGTVRVVNGSDVKYGRVQVPRPPRNFLALIQVVEYLRAFLYGRVGWNFCNATLVISGAFGLFNKKAVKEVGGYKEGSVGEDMELVVRLHRYFRENRRKYSIVFVPDPVCWTEVPSDLRTLRRQRDRWQRGLCETISKNMHILFNPHYGVLGLLTFPYFFLVELWGPVIEILALASVIIAYSLGILNPQYLIAYTVAAFIYGFLMSTGAILIEQNSFAKYARIRDVVALFAASLAENFGYRQLNSIWRINGLINFYRGKKAWGNMKREGF